LQYFERLIVNESLKAQKQPISFLKTCVFPMLEKSQRDELTCQVIDKFLSEPLAHLSQKAVIDALVQLEYSSDVLIKHLKSVFEPYLSGQAQEKSKLILVFSVLKLVHSNYKLLKTKPVGKEAQETEEDIAHDE
jgi:hypothetical protein